MLNEKNVAQSFAEHLDDDDLAAFFAELDDTDNKGKYSSLPSNFRSICIADMVYRKVDIETFGKACEALIDHTCPSENDRRHVGFTFHRLLDIRQVDNLSKQFPKGKRVRTGDMWSDIASVFYSTRKNENTYELGEETSPYLERLLAAVKTPKDVKDVIEDSAFFIHFSSLGAESMDSLFKIVNAGHALRDELKDCMLNTIVRELVWDRAPDFADYLPAFRRGIEDFDQEVCKKLITIKNGKIEFEVSIPKMKPHIEPRLLLERGQALVGEHIPEEAMDEFSLSREQSRFIDSLFMASCISENDLFSSSDVYDTIDETGTFRDNLFGFVWLLHHPFIGKDNAKNERLRSWMETVSGWLEEHKNTTLAGEMEFHYAFKDFDDRGYTDCFNSMLEAARLLSKNSGTEPKEREGKTI